MLTAVFEVDNAIVLVRTRTDRQTADVVANIETAIGTEGFRLVSIDGAKGNYGLGLRIANLDMISKIQRYRSINNQNI